MGTFEGVKTFYPKSRAEWRRWLARYSEIENRIYLIVYHKKSGKPSVGFQEAIDEAICFGWIDSKGKKRDRDSSYWCFSRRNPKSTWGRTSRERAARMIQSGLMTDRGLAMIELAKRTGTWEAYADAENLLVPSDLQQRLENNPKAQRNFESFAPSSKRIVLQWIAAAKRPETRERRIKRTVELAEHNEIAGLPEGMRENRSRRATRTLRPRESRPRTSGRGAARH
jgi:uncharacterized protein YdeI (YjbR/CyaY-like superfamily)